MGQSDVCGATRDNEICLKLRHRGGHKFEPRPHVPPKRDWIHVEYLVLQADRIQRVIRLRDRVKVTNIGRLDKSTGIRATQSDWVVQDIERHVDGRHNVTVHKAGETRIFPSDRIRYQQQKRRT